MTSNPQQPPTPVPETPTRWLGDIVRERVVIEDRAYLIDRPSQSDCLIDHPAAREAKEADDNLPYWAELWPAARMLATTIVREPLAPGIAALEIGCGLGLPGIAALSMGLRVTFSDYDPTALLFAADNARVNGFGDFETLRLDWRFPPDNWQVPVLLASDLVFEVGNVEPVVNFVKKVLAPGGLCLLTDQDRLPSLRMRQALEDSGMPFTAQIARAAEPGKKRVKGTLYRIRGKYCSDTPK